MYQAMISEIAKNKLENFKPSFDEINRKMSPDELLKNSEKFGISGDKSEVDKIKNEVENILKSYKGLPVNDGEWVGVPGDSTWKPDPEYIPKTSNEEGKTWRELLDEYGIEGIEFVDGEPDFTPISEATVEIEDFTDKRSANFTQADEALSKQWTDEGKDGREWTAEDVKNYRKENNLTWHERSDMKTLDLVPQEIHGNISHHGGIAKVKS